MSIIASETRDPNNEIVAVFNMLFGPKNSKNVIGAVTNCQNSDYKMEDLCGEGLYWDTMFLQCRVPEGEKINCPDVTKPQRKCVSPCANLGINGCQVPDIQGFERRMIRDSFFSCASGTTPFFSEEEIEEMNGNPVLPAKKRGNQLEIPCVCTEDIVVCGPGTYLNGNKCQLAPRTSNPYAEDIPKGTWFKMATGKTCVMGGDNFGAEATQILSAFENNFYFNTDASSLSACLEDCSNIYYDDNVSSRNGHVITKNPTIEQLKNKKEIGYATFKSGQCTCWVVCDEDDSTGGEIYAQEKMCMMKIDGICPFCGVFESGPYIHVDETGVSEKYFGCKECAARVELQFNNINQGAYNEDLYINNDDFDSDTYIDKEKKRQLAMNKLLFEDMRNYSECKLTCPELETLDTWEKLAIDFGFD